MKSLARLAVPSCTGLLLVTTWCAGLLVWGNGELAAEDWPQWRGPHGNGISRETALPVQWSETEGLAWKVDIPEWGTSTPAIKNGHLFLTTEHDGQLLLLCYSTTDGHLIWQRECGQGAANRKVEGSDKRTSKFHNLHNMASPSPITDGERVIVHFGNGELGSYRSDGEPEWRRNLVEDFGPYSIWWGHANSPVLYGDLVISCCMQDPLDGVEGKSAVSYLVAHNKRTGQVVWTSERMTGAHAEEGDSYTTPIFAKIDGRTEMIVMGGNVLDAYNPQTGQQIWQLSGLVGGRTITGPTLADGIVYTTIGMRGPLHAVRLGKTGLVSAGDVVLWQQDQSTPDTCCPVVYNGLIFIVTDRGIASCLDAKTGELKWRERLTGGNYKASPVVAAGRVYFANMDGDSTVIRADGTFEVLAINHLDDEFTASPAISGGRIYLRGKKTLYAIGK